MTCSFFVRLLYNLLSYVGKIHIKSGGYHKEGY